MPKQILVLLCLLNLLACKKKTNYANIPKIVFKNLTPSTVKAGSQEKISVYFNFEDGDGNIGFGKDNIFFKDSRDTNIVPFKVPTIPNSFNPSSGLKGIIQIDYSAAFLLLRTDTLHKESDTLHWTIYMKDEADNTSNVITTTDVILTK